MAAATFSKDLPNKISDNIYVSGRNTLSKTEDNGWLVAIADEPINAKVDGKKFFCVRIDNPGVMIGLTPMEKFDSGDTAYFGYNGFTGCGIRLFTGNLFYSVNKAHKIIGWEISKKSKRNHRHSHHQ